VDAADHWCLMVITSDFRVLTQKEDVLRAARNTCTLLHDFPAEGSRWDVVVGDTDAFERLWCGSLVSLQVPDTHREEVARGWLKSHCQGLRYDGIQALRSFQSPENVHLLEGLLDDPDSRIDHEIIPTPYPVNRWIPDQKVSHRHFPIRAVAYDTLREWGVNAPPPVLEESVEMPLLTRVLLFLAAVGGILVVLLFRRRWLRRT
jgi:hypothetical protein